MIKFTNIIHVKTVSVFDLKYWNKSIIWSHKYILSEFSNFLCQQFNFMVCTGTYFGAIPSFLVVYIFSPWKQNVESVYLLRVINNRIYSLNWALIVCRSILSILSKRFLRNLMTFTSYFVNFLYMLIVFTLTIRHIRSTL